MNSIEKLGEAGQSIWLDFIQRELISSGQLAQMTQAGLKGVTSNPAIFEKAVASSSNYDDFLAKLNENQVLRPIDLYEALAIRDVQDAADVFTSVYQASNQQDGYVSLEVSPHLALDAQGTLDEARRLWARVNRPNVMIKVPATPVCIPVIEQLIADGINVNVTLLFSQKVYAQVANAYMRGLESRVKQGKPIAHIASVASFFISRIDSAVDKLVPEALGGKAAIANAKLTYEYHLKDHEGSRWKALEKAGAQRQRLLWASTSTKNPKYRDVLYIEELIGPHTVNTVPPATYDAYLDHGEFKNSLQADLEEARQVMADLKVAGVDFDQVTDQLLNEGIKLFVEPFDKMLAAIESKHPPKVTQIMNLWDEAKTVPWLGWLDAVGEPMKPSPVSLLPKEGLEHCVLLGMGGSSLAPDVFNRTFGPFKGFHVVDSTDPDQITSVESKIEISKTLFIVSSKSGSTLEPNIYFAYFFEKAKNPKQFIAITDPGSSLEKLATEKGFAAIYPGVQSIGGRYSALSNFGLVPAALMGAPIEKITEHARSMREACKTLDARANPGARLGISLGRLALAGRDKITLIASGKLEALGDWVEQLIAESTGKLGKGLIPIVGETVGEPAVYGSDRTFVYTHLAGDNTLEPKVEALERAENPVIRIEMPDLEHLGAEFYRWEIAVALAGYVIGINPFDQPDVEAAKIEAKRLMAEGKIPPHPPSSTDEEFQSLLGSIKPHDYLAIQAFVPMTPNNQDRLQKLRIQIRDKYKIATTIGFGPRFLHSTGQLHKGGPNTGVFLQVVSTASKDLKVPGQSYTFDQVKHAQALGDFNVLKSRSRRVIAITWDDLCKLG